MKVLITGGAGFLGSNLALALRRDHPDATIVAFDNLKRRGSELNLPKFKSKNIRFVHGDIRQPTDFDDLDETFDLFIEASAEPSVLAGTTGSPAYLLGTNLVGTLNCLEFARKNAPRLIFLSTSRVYSIQPLREIALEETATRFQPQAAQRHPGIDAQGISEAFPSHLPRSLYGATKLASELFVQEYVNTYGLRAIINRCGVIAGPGQFGKVDQGVFTLWVANHYFGKSLRYTGFGGQGKQVRDLLHPEDLYSLIKTQTAQLEKHSGEIFNAGGGAEISTSLLELTRLCEEVTGRQIEIGSNFETNPVDIPYYVTNNGRVSQTFNWQPRRNVRVIVENIHDWIRANEAQLRPIFG